MTKLATTSLDSVWTISWLPLGSETEAASEPAGTARARQLQQPHSLSSSDFSTCSRDGSDSASSSHDSADQHVRHRARQFGGGLQHLKHPDRPLPRHRSPHRAHHNDSSPLRLQSQTLYSPPTTVHRDLHSISAALDKPCRTLHSPPKNIPCRTLHSPPKACCSPTPFHALQAVGCSATRTGQPDSNKTKFDTARGRSAKPVSEHAGPADCAITRLHNHSRRAVADAAMKCSSHDQCSSSVRKGTASRAAESAWLHYLQKARAKQSTQQAAELVSKLS